LKKQTRSRILSLAITSVALGASVPIISRAVASTQVSPSQALLNRGATLLAQRDFASAKKVLLSINPADLSSADRASLVNLLQKADIGIADQSTINTIFQNAQASLNDGHLAHAASLYRVVIASPSASNELVREAKDNLALVQAKQASMAGEMKMLLAKAKAAYAAGELNTASADLRRIEVSGVDLGSQAPDVTHYQYLIAEKRLSQSAVSTAMNQPPSQPTAAATPTPAPVSTKPKSTVSEQPTGPTRSEMAAEQKTQAEKRNRKKGKNKKEKKYKDEKSKKKNKKE
jgi:hypothetical protein